jgi:hypothetical protein
MSDTERLHDGDVTERGRLGLSEATAPFKKGQLVEDANGVRYRVTREYVPPDEGYYDVRCFELVRVSPPEPFQQAAVMASRYRAVS